MQAMPQAQAWRAALVALVAAVDDAGGIGKAFIK